MVAQAPGDQSLGDQDPGAQSPDSAAGEPPGENTEVVPPPSAAEPEPQEAPGAQREQPVGLPWERDKPAEGASSTASNLFGGVTSGGPANPATGSAEPEESAPEDDTDDAVAFLESQYGDLLGNRDKEPTEPEEATAKNEAPAPEPTPSVGAPPPTKSLTEVDPKDLLLPPKKEQPFSAGTPPAGSLPDLPPLELLTPTEPIVRADQAFTTPEPLPESLPEAPVEPSAKLPTTTAPATSLSQKDLWADVPADPVEASPPAPEPLPEPTVTEPTITELPEPLPPPTDFEPAAPEPPVETQVVEAPTLPEPLPEPPVEAPSPKNDPPRVASRAPLASDATKPLPSLPVLSYNTRHMAWLLGSKIALAELADLDGATPTETTAWSAEAKQLAQQLGVKLDDNAKPGASAAERVQRLIAQAGAVGGELNRRHGDDHAALLEIAVKTNALLVMAAERPELAAPVGRSVRNAAERALLPRYLWESSVRSLDPESSPEAIHDTVVRLHERVEPFLR